MGKTTLWKMKNGFHFLNHHFLIQTQLTFIIKETINEDCIFVQSSVLIVGFEHVNIHFKKQVRWLLKIPEKSGLICTIFGDLSLAASTANLKADSWKYDEQIWFINIQMYFIYLVDYLRW